MTFQNFTPKCFPVLILVLAFLQYANTLNHAYAWDDKLVITGNEYTTKGVAGLREIFTRRVSVPYKNEYRPVPQAMFAIEYDLFHADPRAGHLFNIWWYCLTCLMVYVFLRFTFPSFDRLFAFLVTLLFIVHPLHVEVVANIKSRDEILTLFFGLASVMLVTKALERADWKFMLAGVICFALAFLSKSNAVVFLPVIALVVWYRGGLKLSRKLVVSSVAIVILSLALIWLIRHLQSTVADETATYLQSTVLNNVFLWTTQANKIFPTAIVIIGRYFRLFLFPHPLIHLYGYNQIPLNGWTDIVTWLVITAILVLLLIALRNWRRQSLLLFAVAFFAITYSPYSNFFFYAPDTMADRYMFIPSIALAVVFLMAVFKVAALDIHKPVLNRRRSKIVMAVFLLLCGGYAWRTFLANRDWQDDFTLIYNRIRYMENNAAAQAIYGYMLDKEGSETRSPQLRQEKKVAAMKAFTRAIEIYPDFHWAWISIGRVFAQQNLLDKAELAFLKAQRIEPLNAEGYFYLGTLYVTEHEHTLATTYLEKAVLLDPKMEDAYVLLGKAYLQANQIENLGAMAISARRRFPNNVELEALLATYYFRRQNYKEAFQLARAVNARDPNNILALSILSSPWAQSF